MDHSELARNWDRVVHKYIRQEEVRRRYGTEQALTRREIHTIQLVGDSPGLNLRTLAEAQGVTKGAASQMVRRLCDKGLLNRETSPVSLAEIALTLTEAGEAAFRGHEAYHAGVGARWRTVLEDMDPRDLAALDRFLQAVETMLDTEQEEDTL